jgi:hypothetical protein
MNTTVLETAVRSAGVLPSAVEDAVRRLEGHFSAQADPPHPPLSVNSSCGSERPLHICSRVRPRYRRLGCPLAYRRASGVDCHPVANWRGLVSTAMPSPRWNGGPSPSRSVGSKRLPWPSWPRQHGWMRTGRSKPSGSGRRSPMPPDWLAALDDFLCER